MKPRRMVIFAAAALLVGNVLLLQKYIFYKNAHAQAAAALHSLAGEQNPLSSPVQTLSHRLRFLELVEYATRHRWPDFHRILAATQRSAEVHDLDPYLVLSMIYLESRFDPKAFSLKGACGLMQIRYAVWKEALRLDYRKIFDIEYNIACGCRILRHYLNKSGGDLARALYLYNNGYGENGNSRYPSLVLQGKFAAKDSNRG